jgi:hypothetical protein
MIMQRNELTAESEDQIGTIDGNNSRSHIDPDASRIALVDRPN